MSSLKQVSTLDYKLLEDSGIPLQEVSQEEYYVFSSAIDHVKAIKFLICIDKEDTGCAYQRKQKLRSKIDI